MPDFLKPLDEIGRRIAKYHNGGRHESLGELGKDSDKERVEGQADHEDMDEDSDEDFDEDMDESDEESAKHDKNVYVALLKEVIAVVREAEASFAPNLEVIVDKAGNILNSAIYWAYGEDGDFDFLPSYAHSEDAPLVEDKLQTIGHGDASAMLKFFAKFMFRERGKSIPEETRRKLLPPTWKESHPPHPKSTRLSRFRDGVLVSATDATPLARTILQARCEVSSDRISTPMSAAISSDSSALAVIAAGGWKNRDPILCLHLLDEGEASDLQTASEDERSLGYIAKHYRSMSIEPGLAEVAYQVQMDTANKLVLVADSSRVKTFFWGLQGDRSFGDWAPTRGQNVHTLDSFVYDGPIAVLPGGLIARGGKGGVALWDIQGLETHKNGKRIGKGKVNTEDSWRDNDCDAIELSVGSKPSTTVKFAERDKNFAPALWHLHEPTGRMIAAESSHKVEGHYGCFALDVQSGWRKVGRFLGHGANVAGFSTSSEDANLFLTACDDGLARLYDLRHPLPVITFAAGKSDEFCRAVQLVHPDGIPVVFTGGQRSESITAWDVRAKAAVYELGTGNTAVNALSWDAKRNALYAATECDYMDRMGRNFDYVPAKIPRWARFRVKEEDGEKDIELDEEEYDSEYDDDECNWPKRAFHSESFFGYAYDAGEHSLLRYGFKEDPDPLELPAYGQAMLEGGDFW